MERRTQSEYLRWLEELAHDLPSVDYCTECEEYYPSDEIERGLCIYHARYAELCEREANEFAEAKSDMAEHGAAGQFFSPFDWK